MIFDKIVACSSIEEYISLWKGRVFGTTFMVEISDKMNAKLTNWCNHRWEVQPRSMQVLLHTMYMYVKFVFVPMKISTFPKWW
jgi:hypothetical protein